MLAGFVQFLTQPRNKQAEELLKQFNFKIVPMINVDGVYRGYRRFDIFSHDLNRMYRSPLKTREPAIFAIRKLIEYFHKDERLFFYMDLHAHDNKPGCFLFGNAMEYAQQVEDVLFAKIMQINSPHFDFEKCNFSKKNMNARGKKKYTSKRGCGRVAVHNITKLKHCYTLEINFNSGPVVNRVPPKYNRDMRYNEFERQAVAKNFETWYASHANKEPVLYDPIVFKDMGRALGESLLDLVNKNPCSRLKSANRSLSLYAMREEIRKLMDNKDLRKKLGVLKKRNPSVKKLELVSPPRLLSSGDRTHKLEEEESVEKPPEKQKDGFFPPLGQNVRQPRPPLTSKPSQMHFERKICWKDSSEKQSEKITRNGSTRNEDFSLQEDKKQANLEETKLVTFRTSEKRRASPKIDICSRLQPLFQRKLREVSTEGERPEPFRITKISYI